MMPMAKTATRETIKNSWNLIGREFALAINRADVFKLNIQRRNGRHFNFYYGETRQGKKVALLEVF